jgi:hypothetical protein
VKKIDLKSGFTENGFLPQLNEFYFRTDGKKIVLGTPSGPPFCHKKLCRREVSVTWVTVKTQTLDMCRGGQLDTGGALDQSSR